MQKYGGVSRYYAELTQGLIKLNQNICISAGVYCNDYLSSLPKGIVKGYKISKYPAKTGRIFREFN